MILTRISSKAQTTIPRAVQLALGLAAGDELVWEIDGDSVKLVRAQGGSDPFVNNFSTFSEWASAADCEAFDNL